MKKTVFTIALMSGLMISAAAFAEDAPIEGKTCVAGCDDLPNDKWSYGSPVVTDKTTGTSTTTATSSNLVNIANE
ncbi:MAG: hypothetical protein U1D06_09735, partial [Paracoccaceae bacterium]|nr:hypothetical protein [Paracoccaceae bacterium]